MTVGERIKEIRKAESLTLEKFGAKIGIKQSALSQIERSVINPSEQTVRSICREFGVNEAWLKTGEGEQRIQKTRNEVLEAELRQALAIEPDSFRERLIHIILRLNSEQLEALKDYALELVGDRIGQKPEQEQSLEAQARAEAEAYYKEILAEKKAKALSDSSRSAGEEDGRSETA